MQLNNLLVTSFNKYNIYDLRRRGAKEDDEYAQKILITHFLIHSL